MNGLDNVFNLMKYGKETSPRPDRQQGAGQPNTDNITREETRSTLPLNASSIYHFKHIEDSTVYLLDSYEGQLVQLPGFPNFPSTYKIGKYKGRQYIRFRKTVAPNLKTRFPYTLELENARMFTGLKIEQGTDGVFRGYGDDRNIGGDHCVLVELSKDCEFLDIAFINGKSDISKVVFLEWLAALRKQGL